MDPIPWFIAKSQWTTLSEGLIERAALLNMVLADLYGPQDLLQRGLIPPQLVLAHPGFLRPCHGISVPKGIHLQLYAARVVRARDGRWLVLSDHVREPTGAGEAIGNRIALSRALPAEFHRLQVERLASFFMTLQETLRCLAREHVDNPRVVLLTPGPQSPTYVEDIYLARYLGYMVVEGGDVTVRGTSVFLKTLGGLLSINVILRRLPDEECDPLALRPSSSRGIAGLVQAARSGRVAIANTLGAGFLEAPAIMAFLPAISRHLLGNDLRLDCVPTWWCGCEAHWRYVRDHFESLVIRPAVHHDQRSPIVVAELSRSDREELLRAVARQPAEYVAQAPQESSTAPVWRDGALRPWPVSLKAFAVAAPDGRYQVMPGGLGRATPDRSLAGAASVRGGAHKDVWILSEGPVATPTLLRPRPAAIELRRSVNDIPSRVAENLYWLGRHMERAEAAVRLLRSCMVRLTSEIDPSYLAELAVLVRAACQNCRFPDLRASPPEETVSALKAGLLSFLFPSGKSGQFAETLGSVVCFASVVRDRLSLDIWAIANQLNLDVLFPWPKDRVRPGNVLLVLNHALNLLSALSGLGMESMTRGPGWRFMDMGRRIERAFQTLWLLQRTLVGQETPSQSEPPQIAPLLEAILEVADSSMTYRYRYLTSLELAPLLDLLLVDETNPRSVGFQLAALSEHVRAFAGKEGDPSQNRESRIVLAAQGSLRLIDVEALAQGDFRGTDGSLNVFLDQLMGRLREFSDSITPTYFTHTGTPQPLGTIYPQDRTVSRQAAGDPSPAASGSVA